MDLGPLWAIKELVTWHNYLNARYFRAGRYLRSFVVSDEDKEREELVCLLGPDLLAAPGSCYHGSHSFVYLQ